MDGGDENRRTVSDAAAQRIVDTQQSEKREIKKKMILTKNSSLYGFRWRVWIYFVAHRRVPSRYYTHNKINDYTAVYKIVYIYRIIVALCPIRNIFGNSISLHI
jgi:hypothetical protein